METTIESVFFDIDGTLVDSNDGHARAWVDAFAERGEHIAFDRIRPLIGMGSDKLLATFAIEAESDEGRALGERSKALFLRDHLGAVVAFPGARDLVESIKRAGLRRIVASSASGDERDPLLEIARVRELFDHAVEADEIAASKPDPDVVLAALAWSKTQPSRALMIGDTSYDIDAAHRAGVRCIAFRCGGSPAEALTNADAIYGTPGDLAAELATTTLDALLARGQ